MRSLRAALSRIRQINRCELYLPAAGDLDRYPRLRPALTNPIRWELIEWNLGPRQAVPDVPSRGGGYLARRSADYDSGMRAAARRSSTCADARSVTAASGDLTAYQP